MQLAFDRADGQTDVDRLTFAHCVEVDGRTCRHHANIATCGTATESRRMYTIGRGLTALRVRELQRPQTDRRGDRRVPDWLV